MKIQRLFLILSVTFLYIVVGCVNGDKNFELKIEIEKRVGDENKYEDYKEITNNEQVKVVKEILNKVDWENVKVNMVRPADFTFGFQYISSKMDAKAVLYELWISPNKDKVELVIDAESKYSQLNEEDSAVLLEIITAEKLSK